LPHLPHLLADDPADGIGGILFHLRRGVGVGVQEEKSPMTYGGRRSI